MSRHVESKSESAEINSGYISEIDKQVIAAVKSQHEKAVSILQENRSKLDEPAQFLYENETITGEQFMKILNS